MAYRIVALQLVVVIVTASVMSLVATGEAVAALLAGVVSVVPAAIFAWRSASTRQAARIVGLGVGKMVLTILLMVAVFAVFKPLALGFFVAFVAAQTAYVVAPLLWPQR